MILKECISIICSKHTLYKTERAAQLHFFDTICFRHYLFDTDLVDIIRSTLSNEKNVIKDCVKNMHVLYIIIRHVFLRHTFFRHHPFDIHSFEIVSRSTNFVYPKGRLLHFIFWKVKICDSNFYSNLCPGCVLLCPKE